MTGPGRFRGEACGTCGRETWARCPVCLDPFCNHCLGSHQHGASVAAWVGWAAFVVAVVALVTAQAWF